MTTLNTIAGAIARSISHDEIVTVRVGSEERIEDVYNALIADSKTDYTDYVHATPTLLEVWGWNEGMPDDEMVWRVHLIQDERVGSSRKLDIYSSKHAATYDQRPIASRANPYSGTARNRH